MILEVGGDRERLGNPSGREVANSGFGRRGYSSAIIVDVAERSREDCWEAVEGMDGFA